MEHIQRTHPLGVTLSQIVVDSHHVYTLVRQSIQEYWQGSHQCLTFTRSHLGDRTALLFVVLHGAVEYHTTNELDIVMHHIPDDLVTTRSPRVMIDSLVTINIHEVEARISSQVTIHLCSCHCDGLVLCKTASGTLDNSKRIWQDIVERLIIDIQHLLFKAINFIIHFLALVNIKRFNASFELDDL